MKQVGRDVFLHVCILHKRWVVDWHVMGAHTEPRGPVSTRGMAKTSLWNGSQVKPFLTVPQAEVGVKTDLNLPQQLEISILSTTKNNTHIASCTTDN